MTRGVVVLAAVVVLATVVALAWTTAIDYDEAVYFGIAREITRHGCPIRPEGAGATYLNNPPLVCYATALFGTLGWDWQWLRVASTCLWGGLLVAGVAAWARTEGRWAAALAVALLAAQPFLLREAALVKLDVPLAALAAVHMACARDTVLGTDRRRGLALTAALAVLTRYQGVLLACTSAPILWWSGRRAAAVWALGGAMMGALSWLALATACDADLVGAFVHNAGRLSAASTEPWFQRPLVTFWIDLAVAVGPTTGVAAIVAALVHGRPIAKRPALVLAIAWAAVNLGFCSVIALKAERYFAPAFASFAVMAASLPAAIEARVPAAARAARWIAIGLVLAAIASTVAAWGARPRGQLNAHYRRVGELVAAHVEPDDRVLLPYSQVAWFADRHYVVSLFEPDGARLLSRLRDPSERIELFVHDERISTFHPQIDPAARAELERYVADHFRDVPTALDRTVVSRRVRW